MKNPVALLGGLIILLALLIGDAVVYNPNRIMKGSSFSFFQFMQSEFAGFAIALLIGLSVMILIAALWLGKAGWSKDTIGSLSLILTFFLLLFSATAIDQPALTTFEFGRISLGSGFWLLLTGIITTAWGTQNRRRIYIIGIVAIFAAFVISGQLNELSILKEYFSRSITFAEQVQQHLAMSVLSVVTGILIGVPLGVYVFKSGKPKRGLMFVINLGQTIPTLSLLGLLMVPLGVGMLPAFVVLTLYALFPIVHNTISGLTMVDKSLVEAARGMGMTNTQVFWRVEVPTALLIIFGGIRTALTQSVGNTILAGLIGGGGLGSLVFLGLAQAAPDLILLGVIPIVMMAFLIDVLAAGLIYIYKRIFSGRLLNFGQSLNGAVAET